MKKKAPTNKLAGKQMNMGAYPAGKRTSFMSWCVHRGMSFFCNDASCRRNGRMTIIIFVKDYFNKETRVGEGRENRRGKEEKTFVRNEREKWNE